MQSMDRSGMQMTQPGLQNEQSIFRGMKPLLTKQLMGLGVVHSLLGVFCIMFQSISLANSVNNNYHIVSLTYLGYGFWNGALFLVTGIIGIGAGILKKSGLVIAFNVLSIISAALTPIMLILAVVSAAWVNWQRKYCEDGGCPYIIYDQLRTITAMESLLAVLGILEGIVAIWSSIVCCIIGACCCYPASEVQTQGYIQQQPMIVCSQQQTAMSSNPLFMSNQQQPVVGFYPHQQTVQYNPQRPNMVDNEQMPYLQQSYSHKGLMPAEAVEKPYNSLKIQMERDLPAP